MTALILTGHDAAARKLAAVRERARAWAAKSGRKPCLAATISGGEGAAHSYWTRIAEFAESGGVATRLVNVDGGSLIDAVARLSTDAGVDAILPLAPYPAGVSVADIARVLDPRKDVDGLTPHNAGLLARGLDGLFPCTPQAAIMLAEEQLGGLRSVVATVIGASPLVGRPLVEMLLQRGVTVTVAHVDTRDLVAASLPAQLLFVAVGKAGLVRAEHVREGACVIDIGINVLLDADGQRRVVGDVDHVGVSQKARALSAVPDGVGPLTTAFLIENAVRAAEGLSGG